MAERDIRDMVHCIATHSSLSLIAVGLEHSMIHVWRHDIGQGFKKIASLTHEGKITALDFWESGDDSKFSLLGAPLHRNLIVSAASDSVPSQNSNTLRVWDITDTLEIRLFIDFSRPLAYHPYDDLHSFLHQSIKVHNGTVAFAKFAPHPVERTLETFSMLKGEATRLNGKRVLNVAMLLVSASGDTLKFWEIRETEKLVHHWNRLYDVYKQEDDRDSEVGLHLDEKYATILKRKEEEFMTSVFPRQKNVSVEKDNFQPFVRMIDEFIEQDRVFSCASFSDDGMLLFVGTEEGSILVFKIVTFHQIITQKQDPKLEIEDDELFTDEYFEKDFKQARAKEEKLQRKLESTDVLASITQVNYGAVKLFSFDGLPNISSILTLPTISFSAATQMEKRTGIDHWPEYRLICSTETTISLFKFNAIAQSVKGLEKVKPHRWYSDVVQTTLPGIPEDILKGVVASKQFFDGKGHSHGEFTRNKKLLDQWYATVLNDIEGSDDQIYDVRMMLISSNEEKGRRYTSIGVSKFQLATYVAACCEFGNLYLFQICDDGEILQVPIEIKNPLHYDAIQCVAFLKTQSKHFLATGSLDESVIVNEFNGLVSKGHSSSSHIFQPELTQNQEIEFTRLWHENARLQILLEERSQNDGVAIGGRKTSENASRIKDDEVERVLKQLELKLILSSKNNY